MSRPKKDMKVSVLIATKDCKETLKATLDSIQGLHSELLVSDEISKDGTVELIKSHKGRIFLSKETNLGKRKQFLVNKASGDWLLILDSDESISTELYKELKKMQKVPADNVIAYRINFLNYFLSKPLYHGGENYSKIRLFKRGSEYITSESIHEEVIIKDGKVEALKGYIIHHSYRSIRQVFEKFTKYAFLQSEEMKKSGERVSFKKLGLYGPHMFWARFIKEKGYKDGFAGFILAMAFAYMEALTYWLLLLKRLRLV